MHPLTMEAETINSVGDGDTKLWFFYYGHIHDSRSDVIALLIKYLLT